MKFVEKIVLGTAQLGMKYGIANSIGKPTKRKVFEILEFAWEKGIKIFDTAPSYGSEPILGEFIETNGIGHQIRLITKISPVIKSKSYKDSINTGIELSLKNLRAPIEVLFFHSSEDALLLRSDQNFFRMLKINNPISSYGVSIYDTEDIKRHSNYDFKMSFQFPYNILDQRFSKLEISNVKKYARSIFLQGILASKGKLNSTAPNELSKLHKEYHRILSDNNIDPVSFATQFAIKNNEIDFFLFGVETKTQLERLLSIDTNLEFPEKIIEPILKKININLTDPRRWS